MDYWTKVIFNDETRIYISQGDDTGNFVFYRLNESYKDDCLKRQVIFQVIHDMGVVCYLKDQKKWQSLLQQSTYIEI